MTHVTPPYFFDELLHTVRGEAPTPREQTLGFTINDLDWLHTVYYATDAARRRPATDRDPMNVERLLISPPDKPAIALAGVFMMSPTPDGSKAVLYSPYGGMEVFDNDTTLLNEVQARLRRASQRADLVQFLSIEERDALPDNTHLNVTTAPILGMVIEDQEHTLKASQQKNVKAMLVELRNLPDLRRMLEKMLGIMGYAYFPRLNISDTVVNFSSHTEDATAPRRLTSEPLRTVLLRRYIKPAWPEDQIHSYFNPGHDTRTFTQQQSVQDHQRWDTIVEQTADSLRQLLHSQLETYWDDDFTKTQSRRQLVARVMSDKFRVDLALKHQEKRIPSDDSLTLRGIFLADQAGRDALNGPLKIEKVRILAPYQHYVELASTLMMSNARSYFYSQSRGLQAFTDLNELKTILRAMLTTTAHKDELLNFLSLNERSVFIAMDQLEVDGLQVNGDVFQNMADDVIAKQFDNLDHALRLYRRSEGTTDLAALLDSALDVRGLVDNRLLEHDTDGRWSVQPVTLDDGSPTTVRAQKTAEQLRKLQSVAAALEAEHETRPRLRRQASVALQAQLAVQRLDLLPGDVIINTYDTPAQAREERTPQSSVNMVDHFIARLAQQTDAVPDSALTGFYRHRQTVVAEQLANLTISTFNAVITTVLNSFTQVLLPQLPQRLLDNNQAHLSDGLLKGLSGEAALRRWSNSLPLRHLALLGSVLDASNMTRLTRHGLNGFIPDAYGLSVTIGASNTAHALANTFALTERGGTDNLLSGSALLWTLRSGFEAFDSIKHLREVLALRLQDPLMRLPLIENLAPAKRIPHQSYRLGRLQRIDEHLLNNRQQSHSAVIREALDPLFSMRLSAQAFEHYVDSLIQRAPPTNLPRAIHIAESMICQFALPVWLGMARPAEQTRHAELVAQCGLSAPGERDYLHSIPSIRDEAMYRLSDLLSERFPGDVTHTAEDILITDLTHPDDSVQTLTDFALRHLPGLRAEDIRPRSRTATPLPEMLDGSAVAQLVRTLDLKSLYQTRLATRLNGQNHDSRERRQLFYRQVPWQVMRLAHEHTLRELLSGTAWSFIKQIFDMPDGVARAAVGGVTAMIRPLEMIATPGATVAQALGCYLIGPKPGAAGPLVLYAPYSPTHVLKEYADETELLTEFTRPGALQDWVVGQLGAAQQATYRHLLHERRGRETPEIALGSTPLTGNVLKRLYQDNHAMLNRMLDCQFTEPGQLKWETVIRLLVKEAPKGVEYIAGIITYPLVVWRSYKLFKTSAEDLQQHRWLHALKTFAEGVAALASLREELDKLLPHIPAPRELPRLEDVDKAPSTPSPTLAEHDVTAPLRTQLQAFENHDVALAELKHNTRTNVFNDEAGTLGYIPMAGKVYPVAPTPDGWLISRGEHDGPFVQRNALGDWVLDLDQHQVRYGKAMSRYQDKRNTQTTLRNLVNIEATGRQAIAAFSPTQAQSLDEAINVATYYAVTCKRNVVGFSHLHDPTSRLGRFFTQMFGVRRLSAGQTQKIEQRIDEVLDELVNPALVAPDSMRFVSASPRYHTLEDIAFTITSDAQQKIYLTESFFTPTLAHYQNLLNADFDIVAHAQAATLIHEITHLKSGTEDLAYLDSMRPFPDLMNMRVSDARLHKQWLVNLRETALSTLTPSTRLFKNKHKVKRMNSISYEWRDFGDHPSSIALLNKVLSTTGAKDLDDARSIFYKDPDKRIDTILANADSIACMITELGRQLDPGA